MSEYEDRAMREASEDDGITIENNAVVTLDWEHQRMVVLYGGDRNAVLEFRNAEEMAVTESVLADPNFWANFLSTFSSALHNMEQKIGSE
jgi:hypothetical protein